MRTTRVRQERGAVATLVGVLLAGGVLMGFLALSIDVGQLLAEKRQLQNSADAAALSLAQSCGRNNCVAGADSLAGLVDNNANDSVSGIESQCSTNIAGSTLPGCGASTGAWADCSPLPPALNPSVTPMMAGLPYVEVRTRTQTSTAGGRVNSMRNWIAGLTGNSPTSSAGACARAAIGSASAPEPQLPITISGCEWMRATGGTIGGGGGSYLPNPKYQGLTTPDYGYTSAGVPSWPAGATAGAAVTPGGEVVLKVQNPPSGQTPPSPCPAWNGHALPGGFGLLETDPSDNCKALPYAFSWFHTSPGSSTSCDLTLFVGKVVNIPVFVCTLDYLPNRNANEATDPCNTGGGNNSWYWSAGYAKFYLSGFSATTAGGASNRVRSVNPNNSIPNGQNPCSSSETCISGWFVSGALNAAAITGPPSGAGFFGTYAVVPAG